ncbi:hypothetical protein EXIGLDRAFT_752987 [Exidia glandulosa HHB12029]|uniref:Uncharacterized protein n=1 Tax=Exidia glandulosa HHB12029 TaxID=1314781 RepID=A0A165E4U0_EXIGL|nr:hypothetical protein EXIGLDRAFT_752987 [Exidia glandulosa HHB12029]
MPLAHDWLRRVENVRRECDAAHPAKGKKSMYLPVATGQGAHPRIVAGRNPTGNKTSTPVVLIDKSNVNTCRKEYKLLADDAVADVQQTEPADGTATAKIPPAPNSLAQAQVLGKRRRDDKDVDGTEEAWEDQSTQPAPHGQDTANAGSSQVATGALPKIFIRIPPRAVPVSRRARPPPARQSLQRSCKKRRVD